MYNQVNQYQQELRGYIHSFINSFPITFHVTLNFPYLVSYDEAYKEINLVQRHIGTSYKTMVLYFGIYKSRYNLNSAHAHIVYGLLKDRNIRVNIRDNFPSRDFDIKQISDTGIKLSQYLIKKDHMNNNTNEFTFIHSNPKKISKYVKEVRKKK